MESKEIKKKFLEYFIAQGHKIVPSSSLVPQDDPSVLLTSAGMQQFKPYYVKKKDPIADFGVRRVVSCQKCFRTSDIDEVGDNSHLTFFEMLGNFSFNDYFKREAIEWAWEFITQILGVDISRIEVTFFGGEEGVPRDDETELIWKEVGAPADRIKSAGRADNFWGPTGIEGPCGPTAEIYIDGIEVWNLVFNQYYQNADKTLELLPEFGIDTGMGLERLAMVLGERKDLFATDIFLPMMELLEKQNITIAEQEGARIKRIIADHIRSITMLLADGVLPSNKEEGYILRRLIRRILAYTKIYDINPDIFDVLIKIVTNNYKGDYPELLTREGEILSVYEGEKEKFFATLERGLREFKAAKEMVRQENKKEFPGKLVFHLYDTFGMPMELTRELAAQDGFSIDETGFLAANEAHKEISRAGMEEKFKGGLIAATEVTIRMHTATHLLLAALREVLLSPEIYQKGSNITPERLRFDFNFPRKLTEEELKNIEDLVNLKIKEAIPVQLQELARDEALKTVKVSFDPSKYGEVVKVYKIADFSVELCGGPHVESTAEIGKFKIIKEESSSSGVRRIKAVLE